MNFLTHTYYFFIIFAIFWESFNIADTAKVDQFIKKYKLNQYSELSENQKTFYIFMFFI